MRRLAMIAAWLLLLLVLAVTISPLADRPTTGMPVSIERFGAFFVVGCLFSVAYPRRILAVMVLMVAAAIGFEVLQALSPDRHARVLDLSVKALGGLVGAGAGRLITAAAGRGKDAGDQTRGGRG